jgi:hypothetical protein
LKLFPVFALIGVVAVFSGCTGDETNITKTVIGFFEAVSSGDFDSVAEHFPGLTLLSKAEQDAYITVFSGFTRWEVRSIAIEGAGAVAAVAVDTGSENLTIQLPLIYEKKRWIITERTSMRTKIDMVPAE